MSGGTGSERRWGPAIGNRELSRPKHTTCSVLQHSRHTSNSAFPGIFGLKGFRMQPLGSGVGFGTSMRIGRVGRAFFLFPARSRQREGTRLRAGANWPMTKSLTTSMPNQAAIVAAS
jgi:hypothetical protein